MKRFTCLQEERLEYKPKLPVILNDLRKLKAEKLKKRTKSCPDIMELFPKTIGQKPLSFIIDHDDETRPLRIGVVFSGGQASGGHNVICGLFDAMRSLNQDSRLLGFLNGPSGIVDNRTIELTESLIADYRNQGGFDLIGSGRTKIETDEQFEKAMLTAKRLKLDGIVIIGGDDSNTNAALLAEYFSSRQQKTCVIGVPKTIDGDLKNSDIEISFGFDTAAKVFSETIANICRDSLSAKKYYFFIKLMGRSASHIALECALQTHPNYTFIGEEIEAEKYTFKQLVGQLADLICARSRRNKDFGVVLIPEGVIEFIPEFKSLINELNQLAIDPNANREERIGFALRNLSIEGKDCFLSIPQFVQEQLVLDRDPHGNVQVSKIETERLFIEAVKEELKKREARGEYCGKFSAQPHFCGYEGRSCFPSNFDSQYCYALGHVAALLIHSGATGYMSCVKNLSYPVEEWQICGIPLTSMIHLENRKGCLKPVIRKALVNLKGNPFQVFKERRRNWMYDDDYRFPGGVQFFGPPEIKDAITMTLEYESRNLTVSAL